LDREAVAGQQMIAAEIRCTPEGDNCRGNPEKL
jgi:hypothetical protein